MNKEVPAIFMQDPKTGENVYVVSHVDYVDGMPDDFEDYDLDGLQDNVSTINDNLGSVQSQINNLQSQISSMVKDTGWQNITLNSGITSYSTSWTPQYRFITINGVSFLSLKGAVKGLTGAATIGTLPSNVVNKITDIRPFIQSMSNTNGTPNFNRWSVQPNGNINLEYSTTTITNTQWISFDITIML
ncbi:hypothetical protein ISO99_04705 [Staphylococcus sp. 18_1_E_LY]|uniref:Uncharacterized protein n=1 Tax=Staphylococcus lloydii TaxID=2781774 RepID=A0A7T1AYS3_9STAP|nr:hypothetical protein [Staphylococcus lloydii]MBF7019206.1 hypothetical protein [Staphylococcus lloydii]MBF7026934.1 hypothetical protein [Staphylococcus lloydii]QPM74584.1 hypothetical protein ISP08_09570 [Staphylococcus lloydii]